MAIPTEPIGSIARQRAEEELVRTKEELERRSQELAHSLAMMRATLESTTDGILVTDGDGRVVDFNDKFAAMWQLTPEIIAARDHRQLLEITRRNIKDPQPFLAKIDEIYATLPPESCDMLHLADGRVFERFSRIQIVNEQIVGRVWSFRDISEHKRTEEALRDMDRRKNDFLALLGHELRNPLAPIRNALQILRHSGGNLETVQSLTDMMERRLTQMVRLVDDLLDVSRISRGKLEIRKERVDLLSVVRNAVETSRPLCESMTHELTVSLPPEPLYLNGDAIRLAEVLGNLLNNACKFTHRGGRIRLTVEREGDQAVIRVRDSGIGISADQLHSIFDLFMQVDTSLERSVSGLGIGLSLTRTLVELHDGTVEVHSAGVGQGSEFVVRLPILAAVPKAPPVPTVSEPTNMLARRILVVDDDRDSAMSLAALLARAGHETHTASDGVEAVETAARLRPDLILLDIGLPRLNGYRAAQKIREEAWGESMILVALTGWGQQEDFKKSKEAGFNAHWVKPVDPAALKTLVAELVGG